MRNIIRQKNSVKLEDSDDEFPARLLDQFPDNYKTF